MNFTEMKNEILNTNRADIFNKYLEIFCDQLSIPTRNICVGERWIRGRTHCDTFKVSFDDYDTAIEFPFFKKDIGVPPTEQAKSFRFNKKNIAYLYLTSDINICMSEIRLKENEICSISDFKCVKSGVYVDVISMLNIDELRPLAEILLQPIENNKRIYEITQFISDIFKELGYSGILYPSTLIKSNGKNLVCFYPNYFIFVMYSDRIYKGVLDKCGNIIPVSQMDEFKKYPDYRKEMYFLGDTPEKEEAFEYIIDKIFFEDEQEYKARKEKIIYSLINNSSGIEWVLDEFVEHFSKTHLRKEAYQFRGAYYINVGKSEIGIQDYIRSLNICQAERANIANRIIDDIFKSCDVNEKLKTKTLKIEINEVCNKYFLESDKKWDKTMKGIEVLTGKFYI